MPSTDSAGKAELAGKRVLILGTGREGVAVAEALAPIAGELVAVDDKAGPSHAAWRQRWGERIPIVLSEDLDLTRLPDAAVKSPGISKNHPLVRRLREAGVPVTTGTNLWLAEHAGRTTAVTGSKGKSTTSALIHHLTVALHGPAVLGGNMGLPLLGLGESERYVVELSSYQCADVQRSPRTVVLTALFPEHLDWHGSEADYYADKLNLAAHGPERLIVNARDQRLLAELARVVPEAAPEPVGAAGGIRVIAHEGAGWFADGDLPLFPRSVLPLLGEHNGQNAALALTAVQEGGFRVAEHIDAVREALASFRPLEHRLEPISDPSGLTFIDDTLSTSPYAAVQALLAFPSSAVTLLVGGQDRGVGYEPLAKHLAEHPVALVVGMPDAGERILAALPAAQEKRMASDLAEAVVLARAATPPGGTVLLSPAAPSYGVYRDFAERAAHFREVIAATAPAAG